MRLADFVETHLEDILAEWDAFAATRLPLAKTMDSLALRDHAPTILQAIANDLRRPQTAADQMSKSRGLAAYVQGAPHTAAEVHGALRAQNGFSVTQLVSEYRALRASVLRLWTQFNGELAAATVVDDVMRFNEAIDQAVAESVDFFGQQFQDERIAHEDIHRELVRNRARLEYASRLSRVGFWYCDLPFDVLEWDERVKEHFFLAPTTQVTIEKFYEQIHPEDRETTRLAIEASINSRNAYDIVYRTCNPETHEMKWIRALGGTDYASDGSPVHFDGITVDVTAQKLEEKRVAESEARHRGVLTNMDEAFVLFDKEFDIVDTNDSACRLVNIPRAQMIGANHWVTFPGTYESELGQMYRQVLSDGSPRSHETHYVYPDGREAWYEVRAFRVGEGVAVLFRDVTERRAMVEALKNADKRKDEFLAMLAHELRNPLAPITSASEILARISKTDTPIAAATAVIRRQAKHMTRLIDDLLDVSRITQGRILLKKTNVDIADIVDQAVETCAPHLQAKQQNLTISTDKSPPIFVEGDTARLVQCVGNILANAIKYTDPHGMIEVSVNGQENDVVIVVKDTGSGISPELLPQVFELFVQSDRTLDRAQGGLGVGLAVVKRLTEMHGGQVHAASQGEGFGSTFEIRLPRITASAVHQDQTKPAKKRPMRVLVVDDNVDAAETLVMLLEMQGHVLMAVHTAQDALAKIEAFQPDVMLIDIGLPDIDGYSLAKQLNGKSLSRELRKIAITGYGQPEDRQRALDVGFDDHLVKPVDVNALERVIAG